MLFDEAQEDIVESWQVIRLDQLTSLVAGLAGRDDIKLQFGKRWAWSAKHKTVLLPKHDLVDLNRCRAIASHEVGHVLFTRHMDQLNIPPDFEAIPAVFLHTMHNVYEDPRIEVAVGKLYPGAEFWLRRLHTEEEADADSLATAGIPLAMQYFFAHIREYHRDWKPLPSEDIDPLIAKMLTDTQADRKAMAVLLPESIEESGPDLDSACRLEVDVRMPEGNASTALLDSVEQRKLLAQARMMQRMEGRTREYAFELYALDEKRIEKVLRENLADSDSLSSVFREAFGSSITPDALVDIIPSQEAKDILKEWYERQRTQFGVSTELDFRNARLRNGEADRLSRHRRRRRGGDSSIQTQSLIRTYDSMRQKVANQIQKMTQELQNVLRPTRAAKWKDGYTSGSKVNLKRMIQREARNQGDLDFWQRKTQISKRSVAATLLIDLSGSMHGFKSEAALQGAILFWESLHSLGIAASIDGFKTERVPILRFGDPIVQENRKKIANMLNLVGSVNHDAVALSSAFEELIRQPADEHVLIVISDGQPVGPNADCELHRVVSRIKGRVHLIGLGLGADTRHVEQYYPYAKGEIPIANLSKEIGLVLQNVLRYR